MSAAFNLSRIYLLFTVIVLLLAEIILLSDFKRCCSCARGIRRGIRSYTSRRKYLGVRLHDCVHVAVSLSHFFLSSSATRLVIVVLPSREIHAAITQFVIYTRRMNDMQPKCQFRNWLNRKYSRNNRDRSRIVQSRLLCVYLL